MKFDYRLLNAIKAYKKQIKKDMVTASNGEIPKSQEQFVRRIARWSAKIINS